MKQAEATSVSTVWNSKEVSTELSNDKEISGSIVQTIKHAASDSNVVEAKEEFQDFGGDRDDDKTVLSDLRRTNRRIWVVTTASLPWRTGTSVNPLARALYLTRSHDVTLVVPWLPKHEDQVALFGADCTFDTMEDQEIWVRQYCKERVQCEKEAEKLKIKFYSACYSALFASIFATVDICALIPNEEADVAILEEPEHLTWFRVPPDTDQQVDGSRREKSELGWAVKFNHVVGILHTNYAAYVDQYGMGASFVAASALGSLSSLVVRAYCHRVIRLSAALPDLDETKEVTQNVHGVRSEFFEPPKLTESANNDSGNPPAIYFIGKLIWAKGFDKLLNVEDLYRRETGSYFSIDIYGSGNDENPIRRAFTGRKGVVENSNAINDAEEIRHTQTDRNAASVFGRSGSLRSQLGEGGERPAQRGQRGGATELGTEVEMCLVKNLPDPLQILGDLSSMTINTSVLATVAGAKVSEKLIGKGIHATFAKGESFIRAEVSESDESDTHNDVIRLRFDPAKSMYELRTHPIPARFLGVKDHAILRDIPSHKIFLNPSTTEVLCTTTAEALAMGKFAIIPSHPSNDFFLQFPNCLTYLDNHDCVNKIRWALQNDPEPLSEESSFKLTWEGANERLFEAAAVTYREVNFRRDSGNERSDNDAARFHIGLLRKGQFIKHLL